MIGFRSALMLLIGACLGLVVIAVSVTVMDLVIFTEDYLWGEYNGEDAIYSEEDVRIIMDEPYSDLSLQFHYQNPHDLKRAVESGKVEHSKLSPTMKELLTFVDD